MRTFAVVLVFLLAIAAGATTCSAVVGEKPIGSDGRVLGFFDGARPSELRALVEEGGKHRLIEPHAPHADRASVPAGATLVTSGEAKLEQGWARVAPTTVDGRAAFRLKGGFDDALWSCTYVVDGGEVRWLSGASLGQMGPIVGLFDGLVVAIVVVIVGLLLTRLVPRPRAR